MQIYVFRHGIAEPRGMDKPDADRALTQLGFDRTHLAAQGLARFADRPDVILTSPLLRARQTAEIIANLFGMTPKIAPVLADNPAVQVIHMLRDREEERVMIVGHEPTLSEVIESLCTHKSLPAFIELKKAACALIDAPLHPEDAPGPGTLKWLLPPRALRAIAQS